MFDLWAINPDKMRSMSPEDAMIFESLFNSVYDRLYPLDAEIEAEEAIGESDSKFIMVELTKSRIGFKGYSVALTEKMQRAIADGPPFGLELGF
jgi:hypothetical protein